MSVRYTGFWARVLASLIDTVLLSIVIYPLGYAIYGASYFETGTQLTHGPLDTLLQYALLLVVVMLFWIYRSATPGKIMLKARIVDAKSFGLPAKGQLLVRYLGYYVSLFTLGLGFFWVGWDARKQGFHDKLAGTVVIYDEPVE